MSVQSSSTFAIPRVLSIAGTDPTGGAGVQADLKSIAANGGYGMAVVTALVAQNTRGVRSVHVPPIDFLGEQLRAVSDDVKIDGVKIGMLANAEVIGTVTAWLDENRPSVVVLDPVMVATSGDRLLTADAEDALRSLLGRVELITPNIPELAVLAGEPVASRWEDVIAQAERVSARYSVIVLAKGGHLDGADAPDALVDARQDGGSTVLEFPGRRIDTRNTHGTGCSLSSAIATLMLRHESWEVAVRHAKRWLTESIEHGAELNVGGGNGPINHFAGLWARGGIETAPTPGEVADEWWRSIEVLRREIDELPFVTGLADGSLDRDAFIRYLAQDAIYLRDYARVMAEASRIAPTVDEQAFWASSAQGSLVAETELHTSWLADAVFDAEPDRVTAAYLDHLLATAARGDYDVLIAALLPCFWIYQDVGERMHAAVASIEGSQRLPHPYRSWIDAYGDPAFADANRRAIDIVTRAASTAAPEKRMAMLRAFTRSAEHEYAFFVSSILTGAHNLAHPCEIQLGVADSCSFCFPV